MCHSSRIFSVPAIVRVCLIFSRLINSWIYMHIIHNITMRTQTPEIIIFVEVFGVVVVAIRFIQFALCLIPALPPTLLILHTPLLLINDK